MSALEVLRRRVQESVATTSRLLDGDLLDGIVPIADALIDCLKAGGTVFFCGNGGSATEAEHLSAELLGRYLRDRGPLPSVCLSSNTAAVTAIGNDYGYERIFSRQLRGLGKPGDVLVGLSTSGNSRNVVLATEVAHEIGMTSVAFTGEGGGVLGEVAKLVFRAPSAETPRIQECHTLVGHTLCELVEDALFPPA